ncbi:MAG: SPFH domain-containing protein [Eubacteriales bacterium]
MANVLNQLKTALTGTIDTIDQVGDAYHTVDSKAESALPKDIAQVIKYEGDNQTFVWKHPREDFNTGTQLIVHESQEAIFYANGQILDVFQAGRHTLETQNIPVINKYFNRMTGNQTPFHCEVYFVNKTEQMAIKWGTDSQVEYVEPTYGFPIKLGASGEMSLRVENGQQLLLKVVGTEQGLIQDSLVQKFRMFLMGRFKPYFAQIMKSDKINVFEVDERLGDLSESIMEKLAKDFLDYGVSLEHFFVTTIVKPEEDGTYRKFKELHFRQYADVAEARLRQQVGVIEQQTQAQRMVIEAEGLSQKRTIEGYTYQQERSFDVAEKVATNEGVGEFSNMGIGLGVMAGVGGTVGSTVGGMVTNSMGSAMGAGGVVQTPLSSEEGNSSKVTTTCSNCSASLPSGAKFCLECGTKTVPLETICPNCGEQANGKFCMECGHRVGGEEENE